MKSKISHKEDKPSATLRAKCHKIGRQIEDIYSIYVAEHPGTIIEYDRFEQAASEPYTISEYHIAKAADEIIDRIRSEQNEQVEC